MASYEGPYLLAALLCEKVLEEKDGIKSAIRMIDRIIRTIPRPDPPTVMEAFSYGAMILIRLKSGNVRGVYPLKIIFIAPSGESRAPLTISVNFEGEEDRGVDIVVRTRFQFEVPGIHWIEIYLKEDFLTRIPIRVVYIPQITPQRQAIPGGPSL